MAAAPEVLGGDVSHREPPMSPARTHRVAACLLSVVWITGCHSGQPACTHCFLGKAQYPLDASADPNASPMSGPTDSRDAAAHSQTPPKSSADDPPTRRQGAPFRVPRELPGAEVPPIQLPPQDSNARNGERQQAIRGLYARLPNPAPPANWAQGPLTLELLQTMALENNPAIREAAADVEAARGATIQAGTLPNPNVGYQADTVGTSNTSGYHGAYLQQTIITAGKLDLARSAASMDIDSAMLNLRKARIEVGTKVRSFYFAAIVAREKLKLAQALSVFTERLYRAQIELVEGGEAAPYEPLQLRVLALQARASVAQSQQEHLSAWRQLAAALGMPGLPPTELSGRPDSPAPRIDYDRALADMLARHSDLGVAQNNIAQAGFLLRLAEVTPVPDVDVGLVLQRDDTFSPGTMTYNMTLGGEAPVFNKNRGNIITAQANLYRANQALAQIRNDLTGQLGEAFARYEANRVLAESFRGEALRDQVRTYRGVYERYRNDPQNIQFSDVVVAQQTLALTLNQYIDVLGSQWQAVVDVAELVQVDDIYAMGGVVPVARIPALEAGEVEEIPPP